MPFFIRGRGKVSAKKKVLLKGSKRPKSNGEKSLPPNKKLAVENESDEEITSEEDDEFLDQFKNNDPQYKQEEDETPQEKKVRLAKQYIEELRKQKEEEAEDEDDIKQAIGARLKEDILEAAGRLQRNVADSYECPDAQSVQFLRCKHHKLSLTCVVVSSDERFIFSASKDCSIVKWTLQGQRIGVIPPSAKCEQSTGHKSPILSLALSTDGKYLVSGDRGGFIHIWNPETLKLLHTFQKHRGPISGLAFQRGTHMLFSASHDRLVMLWDLDQMAFADNLGGHQEAITGIDALLRESCITSGGGDETVIVYVIPEEKQLHFSARQSSIEGVKLVNEKTFITFGQNGSLALWTTKKKKPHFTVALAHGKDPENGEPFWLTAAASFVNTDVVASGSLDGYVRLWKIDYRKHALEPLFTVPVPGVVNSLEFTTSGSHLVAAVGQEHKLGRWFTKKSAKNSLVIIPLTMKT